LCPIIGGIPSGPCCGIVCGGGAGIIIGGIGGIFGSASGNPTIWLNVCTLKCFAMTCARSRIKSRANLATCFCDRVIRRVANCAFNCCAPSVSFGFVSPRRMSAIPVIS
jgi:hypothetical protein